MYIAIKNPELFRKFINPNIYKILMGYVTSILGFSNYFKKCDNWVAHFKKMKQSEKMWQLNVTFRKNVTSCKNATIECHRSKKCNYLKKCDNWMGHFEKM